MANPYNILKIPSNASSSQIKSAYRKLAKKYHPDHNKGDAKAQEHFSAINNAYSILRDEDKRAQFDRGEINEKGQPIYSQSNPFYKGSKQKGNYNHKRFQENIFAGHENDIFNEIFSNLKGAKTQHSKQSFYTSPSFANKDEDTAGQLAVTLEDIISRKKLTVNLNDGQTLAIALPKNAHNGQVIRLKGQGQPNPMTGARGDAFITLKFVPHPLFKVDGNNLRYDAYVKLHEAYLGAKLEVPTLTGRIQVTIPARCNSGKVLRIPGKGLPGEQKMGDLLVHILICFPDQIDSEFDSFIKKWSEKQKHNQ